jgi:hypothetical protein
MARIVVPMMPLLPLFLQLPVPVEKDRPATYLLSVTIPLGADERISSFSLDSWGVQFEAVCRIPSGWRIKAGSSATPDGVLEGEGSHGATWLGRKGMREIDRLVLITFDGPMQRDAIRSADGSSLIPATFAGHATIETPDASREAPIGTDNIRLTRASRCP